MLASLAEGTSEITRFSAAADCRSTLDCFSQLGVKIDIQGDRIRIAGLGLDGLRRPRHTLDAGNSGTTMRLLAGILAGQEFRSTLEGDASLRRRPMRRVMDPLTKMGARIHAREGGFAPLKIEGTPPGNVQYIYEKVSATGPYTRPAGTYTRYGDVLPLLTALDDKLVVFGSGDEVSLDFDPARLPALPKGWARDYFFAANGYEKDMDFYAAEGNFVAPLPFLRMGDYPYPAGKSFPLDDAHVNYLLEYNTRHMSGNEQRGYWGSQAADEAGSYNLIGIKNPAVDAMIEQIVYAKNRGDLEAATRALDRILLWNHYVVPQWTYGKVRTARWNRFGHPDPMPKYGRAAFPNVWWWDADKAAKTG